MTPAPRIKFIEPDTYTPEERGEQRQEIWSEFTKLRDGLLAVLEAGGLQLRSQSFENEAERKQIGEVVAPHLIGLLSDLQDILLSVSRAISIGDWVVAGSLMAAVNMVMSDVGTCCIALRPEWQDEELETEKQKVIAEEMASEVQKMLGSDVQIDVKPGVETANGREVCQTCHNLHAQLIVKGEIVESEDFEDLDLPDEMKMVIADYLVHDHDVEVYDVDVPAEMREALEKDGIDVDELAHIVGMHVTPIGKGVLG